MSRKMMKFAACVAAVATPSCFADHGLIGQWDMSSPEILEIQSEPSRLGASGLAFDEQGRLYVLGENGHLLRLNKPSEVNAQFMAKPDTFELNGKNGEKVSELEAISIHNNRIYIASEAEESVILVYDIDDFRSPATGKHSDVKARGTIGVPYHDSRPFKLDKATDSSSDAEAEQKTESKPTESRRGIEGIVVSDKWLFARPAPKKPAQQPWIYTLDEMDGSMISNLRSVLSVGFLPSTSSTELHEVFRQEFRHCAEPAIQRFSELFMLQNCLFIIDSVLQTPGDHTSGNYVVSDLYAEGATNAILRSRIDQLRNDKLLPLSTNFEGAAVGPLGHLYLCTDNAHGADELATLLVRYPPLGESGHPIKNTQLAAPNRLQEACKDTCLLNSERESGLYGKPMTSEQRTGCVPSPACMIRFCIHELDERDEELTFSINGRTVGKIDEWVTVRLPYGRAACRLKAGDKFRSFVACPSKAYTWYFARGDFCDDAVAASSDSEESGQSASQSATGNRQETFGVNVTVGDISLLDRLSVAINDDSAGSNATAGATINTTTESGIQPERDDTPVPAAADQVEVETTVEGEFTGTVEGTVSDDAFNGDVKGTIEVSFNSAVIIASAACGAAGGVSTPAGYRLVMNAVGNRKKKPKPETESADSDKQTDA